MAWLPLKTFSLSCLEWIMNFKLQSDRSMYWMFSHAEFRVFPSMSFEEGVFGSILVSSIVSRKIVLQSAFQYLSPVPKQTTKSTKIWLISQSYYYRLPTKLGEVMFSVMSVHQLVILFTGGAYDHYRWGIGPHCTGPP